jgi:Tol biopolymer transport system component
MKRLFTLLALGLTLAGCGPGEGNIATENRIPPVFPDYNGVTIPVNIAPLNFILTEQYDKMQIIIEGKGGEIKTSGRIVAPIPKGEWKRLLGKSDTLKVTVLKKSSGKWTKYNPFEILVSKDSIDYGLCYRRLNPGYETYSKMGIYQRELAGFRESAILENTLMPGSCVNCHSFAKCDVDNMQIHIRGKSGGTLLNHSGKVEILDTKNSVTGSACVYPYWHPSGRYIAYSVNNIHQIFHNSPDKILDVFDLKSGIVVYDITGNKLFVYNMLNDKAYFNTFPVFSADGRKIFFSRAVAMDVSTHLTDIKYSLCSIDFDPETANIGTDIDTLYDGDSCSVSFPRPSYDGKYIMFTRSMYGNFSIWHKDADLWLYDIADGTTRRIDEINSEDTESYHSWSSNSRWVVFSSRRDDGLHTRLYISHINNDGTFGRPFLLPQRDPRYNDRLLQSYNIPEFINGKVDVSAKEITDTTREKVIVEKR